MSEKFNIQIYTIKDFCAVTQCLKHVNITFLLSAQLWYVTRQLVCPLLFNPQ